MATKAKEFTTNKEEQDALLLGAFSVAEQIRERQMAIQKLNTYSNLHRREHDKTTH